MSNLKSIVKELNQLSYLLHLKQYSIPSNNDFSSVDLERTFTLVHQFIEQLLTQEFEHEPLTLSELNGLFEVTVIDDARVLTDAEMYLDLLDETLSGVLNEYKQAIDDYRKNNSELTLGVLYNQIQRIGLLTDEFKKKKDSYPDRALENQRILKRRNEPFDSEAILDDLL